MLRKVTTQGPLISHQLGPSCPPLANSMETQSTPAWWSASLIARAWATGSEVSVALWIIRKGTVSASTQASGEASR